jgi:hypothetical protein
VLDVGPVRGSGASGDDAGLAVFVDRIAAAGSDTPTSRARDRIREGVAGGHVPPGVRRLAEALAASVGERAPAPRRSGEDDGIVVAALRSTALVVFDDVDAEALAATVTALVTDGRRVVVTAETTDELGGLRTALSARIADRVIDDLPGLDPDRVREVRRLLATATDGRRSRSGQRLPAPAAVPHRAEIAALCARTSRPVGRTPAAGLVPHLLGGLESTRRDAVVSVARYVCRSLAALPPAAEQPWCRHVLGDLIHHRHRPAFDQLREDTAQAMSALERCRTLPAVVLSAPMPTGARDLLDRYAEFLATSGRARTYLRKPAIQRETEPLLRTVTVGGRRPETADDLRRVLEHLELGERLSRIDRGCRETGIPAPRDEQELVRMSGAVVAVAAAARAVGALRHDVLFLGEGSPVSVPDVEAAADVAGAILDFADLGSADEAAARLDRFADELAEAVPADRRSPEHAAAVHALRRRDPAGYAAAVDALGAARREIQDAARQDDLLDQLAAHTPGLAQAWSRLSSTEPSALGFACLRAAPDLLGAMPGPDAADVVLVLGAQRLGVERLLLAAVAPRLVAVVPHGARREAAPTMLSVLERASALVIRGRPAAVTAANVVPMPPPRPAPAPTATAGRVGA